MSRKATVETRALRRRSNAVNPMEVIVRRKATFRFARRV